jgi:hypothetical protein
VIDRRREISERIAAIDGQVELLVVERRLLREELQAIASDEIAAMTPQAMRDLVASVVFGVTPRAGLNPGIPKRATSAARKISEAWRNVTEQAKAVAERDLAHRAAMGRRLRHEPDGAFVRLAAAGALPSTRNGWRDIDLFDVEIPPMESP